MRKTARDLVMRAPQSNKDWCRIVMWGSPESKQTGDGADVYIYDEIGFWGTTASDFVTQLNNLDVSKINVHINSPGGEIFDGLAIFNALDKHDAEVTVYVDALAASAASFIAQAGDKIVMSQGAMMMIHDGSGLVWGNAADMRQTADLLDKLSDNIASIYADAAGGTTEEWRELMRAETWYTADEAVAANLADEKGSSKAPDGDAQNRWKNSLVNRLIREVTPEEYNRIVNTATKEAPVGKLKNSEQQPESTEGAQPVTADPNETGNADPNPSSPNVNPDAETTEGEDDSQTGDPGQTEDTNQPATEPESGTGDPAAPAPSNSANGPFSFKVNGMPVSNFAQVQAHIDGLENFRRDTVNAGKESFVENLASDNKIAATQVKALTEYALSLNDQQYDAWRATWDGAPSISLFGNHAGGTTNFNGDQSAGEVQQQQELNDCREIVLQHKRSNMPNEQIMKTNSYKRLMELDPEFKL